MKKVILATFVTFALVEFTWIFFRAGSMHDALYMINSIFTVYNSWIFVDGSIYSLGLSQKQFSLLILLAAEWMKYKKINILDKLLEQEIWFRWTFISSASYLCWRLAQYIILCPICWRERSVQSGFLSFGRIQKNMMSGLWEAVMCSMQYSPWTYGTNMGSVLLTWQQSGSGLLDYDVRSAVQPAGTDCIRHL